MSKYTKCPQCGTEINTDYYAPLECKMCGWGKDANVVVTPPSNLSYKLSGKSARWKAGVVAAVFAVLIVAIPLFNFSRNQILANHAVAVAKSQMDKRLYASAVRTLNEAPRNQTTEKTQKEMNAILSDTVRWAHDISDVSTAKDQIAAAQPDEALDNLDEVDEDFPQADEAVDLIDLAQDQSIDPSLDVSDEMLDDIAYVPDDPELENLDELTSQAEEELNAPSAQAPNTPAASTATPQTSTLSNPVTTTDPESEIVEDPIIEEELPETPDDSPAVQTPSKQAPHLTNLYQLTWNNKPKAAVDQDSFYTIDFTKEVTPRKDRKSNFSGYASPTAVGQIYNRKPIGNKNIVALYRYWNAQKTDHYYTINGKFSANNANAGYNRQAVAGYIGRWDGAKCLEGTKPLYVLYNAKLTDNFYTTDASLKNTMAQSKNWVNTKVAGCLW